MKKYLFLTFLLSFSLFSGFVAAAPHVQKLQWTAYKTTEKIAVHGIFKTVELQGLKTSQEGLKALEGASFKIPVSSIDSENPERDDKILKFFFGALRLTNKIEGKIVKIDTAQKAFTVDLLFNDIKHQVLMNYEENSGLLTLKSNVKLAHFKALAALEALHKACFELHKGKDGKSELAPFVDILVEISL